MSPFPMPEVTCPEPGDVVHYTEPSGHTHWASIISPPNELGVWAVRAFDAGGELGPTGAPGDRLTLVAKGRKGSPPPFAAGDVVDYRDSDQDEAPGTYRGTITGPLVAGARWHVDLDNGGEEHALPAELTLVRHAGDDEAPDCTRCGHFAANHEGGAGVCLAKDDGVYACHCFTYTANPNPGKDPNAPDDLQQDPAHRTPRDDAEDPRPLCEHPKLFGGPHCVTIGCANRVSRTPEPAPEYDVVEKAEHYNRHPSGIECIEVVRHMGFNLGNAIKYVWRADLKHDAIEDLKKARYYLDDEIARREREAAGE